MTPSALASRCAALALLSAVALASAHATGDDDGGEPPLAKATPSVPAVDPSLNPLSALDRSSLSGFRDKPLFTPSRRRPEPPPEPEPEPVAEAAPPPEAPPPNLKLSGVIEGPEGSVAVVQNVDARSTDRLRLGDSVSGWLVTAIDPVTVRLTLGDREQEYRLFDRERRGEEPPADSASDVEDAPPASDDDPTRADVVQRPPNGKRQSLVPAGKNPPFPAPPR